jgi:UDP-glucuronate decarboxylase
MMDYEKGEQKREQDYTRPHLSRFPGPLNLGDPYEVSIASIAEKIILLTNSKSELVFHKLPENDPRRRLPDISKATDFLKWEPRTGLDGDLRKTIEYFTKT